MTGETDAETEGKNILSTFKDRDEAVSFFLIFLFTLAAGFIMTLRGRMTLGMILMVCAAISIMAVLLRPSKAALERREAARRAEDGTSDEEGGEDEVDEDADDDESGSELLVDGAPAPTSTKRDVPAPPPEPPPMEDVVVDLGDGEVEDAPAEDTKVDDGDVWVE